MQLARILTEYEHSPEAVQGEGPGVELVRVIRRISQMRSRLAEMEAELQELLRSDLFQLKSRLDEAHEFGRDVLQEMVAKVDEQIEQAQERLKKPKSSRRARGSADKPDGSSRHIDDHADRASRNACAGCTIVRTRGPRIARPRARFELADQESFHRALAASRNFASGAGLRNFRTRASRDRSSGALRHRTERADDDACSARGRSFELARTQAPFSPGRPMRAIWLALRARGRQVCICSTCKENSTWEISARQILARRIWLGPIQATTSRRPREESGLRCAFGSRAADLRAATPPENSRHPIGSSRNRPERNLQRKVHLADTEKQSSARTKKRSRA